MNSTTEEAGIKLNLPPHLKSVAAHVTTLFSVLLINTVHHHSTSWPTETRDAENRMMRTENKKT